MTSLNNHSGAGHTAVYLKFPIILTSAAWLRPVCFVNPTRVDEMDIRLASIVQTAWQEPSLQPTAKHIQFHLYCKEEEEQDHVFALLVLSVAESSDEPSYLRIELQEESLPGNPGTEQLSPHHDPASRATPQKLDTKPTSGGVVLRAGRSFR